MRTAVTAAALLCLATALVAQTRPDFSGEWTLNKERSRLLAQQAAAIQRGVVQIEHRDPQFRFHRSFVSGVQEDTLTWELKTDGVEVTSQEGPRREISRLYWEGDTLVFVTRIIVPQGEATNTVHYRLKDAGRTLEAAESFRGPRFSYDNLWVFEKS
jgi:hypothetical protein